MTSPQPIQLIPLTGNPLAPEWMWGECAISTPPGYEDFQFTYATEFIALAASPGAGSYLQNQQLPLDADAEFWLRAFGFALLPNTSFASFGDVGIRYRDGKGRRLMDDLVVIEDIVGPVPPFLVYRPGDVILYDLQNRGANTPSVQLQFLGFKRRKLT
jgi:hypothetical protein